MKPVRAVIDTNVLVSALLNEDGKPAQVIKKVYNGEIYPVTSNDVFMEYEEVLNRPGFKFASDEIKIILEFFRKTVFTAKKPDFKTMNIPHDDAYFAAAAKQGLSEYIITGNKKHFSGISGEKFI